MISDGKEEKTKRKCLFLVEADGFFDGRRRIRLPLRSPSMTTSSILGLKEELKKSLELPEATSAADLKIELYDSTNQSFRRLTRTDEIPPSCCRIRITADNAKRILPQFDSSEVKNRDSELLALPWREFSSSIDLDGKLVLKGGKHSIAIREVSNSGLGTGTNIWDGAIALAKFFEFHDQDDSDDNDNHIANKLDYATEPSTPRNSKDTDTTPGEVPRESYSVRGKRVLELGAGTGLVGIAAHVAFGAGEVILTDLEYSLDNLRTNLTANACNDDGGKGAASVISTPARTIDARMLDWFDLRTCDAVLERSSSGITAPTAWHPDVVLAADVVWVESLVRPLVQTLHRICTKALPGQTLPPSPLILLSYQRRSQAVGDLLFRTLEEHSFRTDDVTSPKVSTTTGAESKIRIYQLTFVPRVDRE